MPWLWAIAASASTVSVIAALAFVRRRNARSEHEPSELETDQAARPALSRVVPDASGYFRTEHSMNQKDVHKPTVHETPTREFEAQIPIDEYSVHEKPTREFEAHYDPSGEFVLEEESQAPSPGSPTGAAPLPEVRPVSTVSGIQFSPPKNAPSLSSPAPACPPISVAAPAHTHSVKGLPPPSILATQKIRSR